MDCRLGSYVIHPLRGVSTPAGRQARAPQLIKPSIFLFFRARCTSFHIFTLLFLPAYSLFSSYLLPLFLCLTLFLLFPCFSVRENTRAILTGTCFFARRNYPCLGRSFSYQKLSYYYNLPIHKNKGQLYITNHRQIFMLPVKSMKVFSTEDRMIISLIIIYPLIITVSFQINSEY